MARNVNSGPVHELSGQAPAAIELFRFDSLSMMSVSPSGYASLSVRERLRKAAEREIKTRRPLIMGKVGRADGVSCQQSCISWASSSAQTRGTGGRVPDSTATRTFRIPYRE